MIYALSSAAGGRSAIAVFRLSGDDSPKALQQLLRDQSLPQARQASRRALYHPVSGDLLDKALILAFQAPDSFTGENMVELHVHGGRAVVQAVSDALSVIDGARYAAAGEFSRTAFANGKMDFTAAEGLADLINADTEAQRRMAVRQADGVAYRLIESWSAAITKISAHVEACLDFSDEELPPQLSQTILSQAQAVSDEMRQHINEADKAERLRSGVKAAIMGAPNVGKSSLLNYFVGREAAIVSHIAGTTRDIIEVFLELRGLPLILADTAGLREEADDVVEDEGIRRALRRGEEADIRLWMFDLSVCDALPAVALGEHDLLVFNKSDKLNALPDWLDDSGGYVISLSESIGLDELRDGLWGRVVALGEVSEGAVIVRARHGAVVREVIGGLERLSGDMPLELVAEELRGCLLALGRLTGRVSAEDLLDIIFSDFCIGK